MMQKVFDAMDVAVKTAGVGWVADEVNLAESTLRSQLNRQERHKLGLVTAIKILKYTKDLRPLDQIERILGRVAFRLPEHYTGSLPELSQMVGTLTKEFGEQMQCMGKAMEDGKVDRAEARKCKIELDDVLKACIKLKAYLERIK